MIEYQGPVPPPEFLHGYNQVIEDGGERLFSMIESEGQHVREQERRILSAQISLLKRGQIFAFVIAMTSMGGAIYVIPHSVAVASLMLTAGVGTLAVAFINAAKGGKKPPAAEADRKKAPPKHN